MESGGGGTHRCPDQSAGTLELTFRFGAGPCLSMWSANFSIMHVLPLSLLSCKDGNVRRRNGESAGQLRVRAPTPGAQPPHPLGFAAAPASVSQGTSFGSKKYTIVGRHVWSTKKDMFGILSYSVARPAATQRGQLCISCNRLPLSADHPPGTCEKSRGSG